jgi:nicotinamide riboside kinase
MQSKEAKKALKIVFVGSHGTGKSSAVSHLASLLKRDDPKKNIGVISENVREVARLVKSSVNTADFQKLCMIDHLHKELSNQHIYDILVIDRSALDTLVYGLVYELTLPAEYFSLALNHMSTYDKVFFVRPDTDNDKIADDGFRDTNPKTRMEVDKEFERLLALWGGEYVEVRTSDIFDFNYLKVLK